MKDRQSTKPLLTIVVMALATAALVACGNGATDRVPDATMANPSAVADDASAARQTASGLPADVPFYLGQRTEDAASLAPGYWRWNSMDDRSSHEQIIANVKQAAQDQGWEITTDQKQSKNTYLMVLSKTGNQVVVTIQPEGDSHRVSYEYLSEAFIKANATEN
ncbi:MAG: hypothetical protein ACOH1V_00010 [Stenotrophomonas sp.]